MTRIKYCSKCPWRSYSAIGIHRCPYCESHLESSNGKK